MKAKYIPQFREWIKTMVALDDRLDARDFNTLFKTFIRSQNVNS